MKPNLSILRLKVYCAILDFIQDWYRFRNLKQELKDQRIGRINETRRLVTDMLDEEINEFQLTGKMQ